MTYDDLIKRLAMNGWYLDRNGKGSHKIWKHSTKAGTLSIPYHGSKDLGKGLANKLLKQAGLQ